MLPLGRPRCKHAYPRRAKIGLEPSVTRRTHTREWPDAAPRIVRVIRPHSNRASAVANRARGACRIRVLGLEVRLTLGATHLALDPTVVVAVYHVGARQRHRPLSGRSCLVQVDSDVMIQCVGL